MNELPSGSRNQYDESVLLMSRRLLVRKEICSPMGGYLSYVKLKGIKGVCLGTTLYWISDSFKNLRTHPFPFGVKWNGKRFYVPDAFKRAFFDMSFSLQKAYDILYSRHDSVDHIIKNLNDQEEFLFCASKGRTPWLVYSHPDAERTINIIGGMLAKQSKYKNTAIIISTSLEHDSPVGPQAHCTALMNYQNTLFFFDANRGVYHLAEPEKLHWSSLIATVANTLDIDKITGNQYKINAYINIFVQVIN